MTSIILAGGKSSRFGKNEASEIDGGKSLRFGQDKALETIGNKSLIQWVIDRLALLSREIIIVTSRDKGFHYPVCAQVKMVVDVYRGKGPFGGIYSGLVASSCLWAIVVGCDMPFLSVALLDYMVQLSPRFDVVVPRVKEKIEPLCALYSKNCLAPMQKLLERRELRIRELFNVVKVRYVEEDEIDRFDPQHLSFFNINTPSDLEKARRLAMEQTMGGSPRRIY